MTADLAHEVAQAQRAVGMSCPGTDEYDQAVAWLTRARKALDRQRSRGAP